LKEFHQIEVFKVAVFTKL